MGEAPIIITRPVIGKWVVWWGMFVFSMWGVLVLYEPNTMAATPLSTIADLFGRSKWGLSFALFSSAVGAALAIYSDRQDVYTRALLFPQVFFMLIACSGSIQAFATGQYADGTIRAWEFIFADQLPWIAAALIYVFSLVEQFGKGKSWNIGFRSWRR